ncbi:kinetochore protein ndc80 like protein [Babesia gibsoni]|uniref:Kinetochore protein NDC80 n=1 Tax=Babesia gibsoni TaxID=33632 RepID=A0AAD8LR61_BABGI|nr:kinetochore protein ndc80 like protein [Babesia gibsoni]
MDSFLSSLKRVKSVLSTQSQSSSLPRLQRQSSVPKYSVTNKKECVQCIIGFLESKGFYPCSAKELLKSPPLQILLEIWNFLFRMVDASMNITKDNMATEVPKFFKDFGYPQIMKTSHMRTPTADHQWESNLVALSWLCKILLYEQEFGCRGKSSGQGALGLYLGGRGKATISNSRVLQLVTDQATKHYQLYIQGEENSMQIMEDFENVIEVESSKLQESVDLKVDSLEELREKTLELQEELEGFAKTKEWIQKAKLELKQIEEVTRSLQASCIQAEEQLKASREALKEEQLGLDEQERRKKELEDAIEAQDINKNVLLDLTRNIKALKTRISETNRRIKEMEHEIPTLESNAHSMEIQLVRAQKTFTAAHESITNFLISNGGDVDSWKNIEPVRVNVTGSHETEILGVSPSTYERVLDEIIHNDRDRMQQSAEARTELEAANAELETLCNALARQMSETLREISMLFKAHILEEKESVILVETEKLAEVIRKAARDELERVQRELENLGVSISEENNRLKQQELRAQEAWRTVVERLTKMYQVAKESKDSNIKELRGIISTEKNLLQRNEDDKVETDINV